MREKEFIDLYGVPKDELRAYRKLSLVQGEDWIRELFPNKQVHLCPVKYTAVGLDKLYAHFKLKTESNQVMAPAELPKEEITQAVVIRCDYPNVRIMLVKLSDGKSVFATVNDARRFKPKMPIAVIFRGNKYYCEHRPTSLLRINNLIKRNK
jgi:hypothetical protein